MSNRNFLKNYLYWLILVIFATIGAIVAYTYYATTVLSIAVFTLSTFIGAFIVVTPLFWLYYRFRGK